LANEDVIGRAWLDGLDKSATNSAAASDRRTAANYVVMLTTGCSDGGKRATLAFAAACAAASLDLDTRVFLIGDGSHWAYQGSCDAVAQAGFPALSELMDEFVAVGGGIYLCAACDKVCSAPDGEGHCRVRRAEIQIQGLAAVLSHTIGGNSITF
jgi:predicted peroxiredoxin